MIIDVLTNEVLIKENLLAADQYTFSHADEWRVKIDLPSNSAHALELKGRRAQNPSERTIDAPIPSHYRTARVGDDFVAKFVPGEFPAFGGQRRRPAG